MMDRRRFLLSAAAFAVAGPALAASSDLYPITSDWGAALVNERVPSDLDPSNLPGAVRAGSPHPDVILIEFFDYNCGFCRGAVHTIDAVLSRDPALQLRLFNNPILAPGSIEAALIQQAVLRAYGPHTAYAFHIRALSMHGVANRASALAIVDAMRLDPGPILESEKLQQVRDVLSMHQDAAKALDLTATPSFLLDGIEIMGWPGPKSLTNLISSVRACDALVCRNLVRG